MAFVGVQWREVAFVGVQWRLLFSGVWWRSVAFVGVCLLVRPFQPIHALSAPLSLSS